MVDEIFNEHRHLARDAKKEEDITLDIIEIT